MDSRDSGDSNRSKTYALVLVVETVTVVALWAFSRYFGG